MTFSFSLKTGILTVLFILNSNSAAAAPPAPEVLLRISCVDGVAIRSERRWWRGLRMRRAFPRARSYDVVVRTPHPDQHDRTSMNEVHRRLSEAVANLDLGEGKIRLFVLDAHGNGGFHYTDLNEVGEVFSSGVSPRAQKVLNPLRGRFTPDARVVLYGCSTLNGDRAQALRRAESLMKYLGVTDGALFGLTGTGRGSPTFRDWLTVKQSLLALAVGAATTALPAYFGGTQLVAYFFTISTMCNVEFMAISAFLHHREYSRLTKAGEINRGLLIRMTDGRASSVCERRLGSDDHEIWGRD